MNMYQKLSLIYKVLYMSHKNIMYDCIIVQASSRILWKL